MLPSLSLNSSFLCITNFIADDNSVSGVHALLNSQLVDYCAHLVSANREIPYHVMSDAQLMSYIVQACNCLFPCNCQNIGLQFLQMEKYVLHTSSSDLTLPEYLHYPLVHACRLTIHGSDDFIEWSASTNIVDMPRSFST